MAGFYDLWDASRRPTSSGRHDGPRQFTREQAEKFLQPHLDMLRTAPSGTINDRLNEAACALSHFVPAFYDEPRAERMLLDALSHTVYDGRTWKAEATIASGLGQDSDPWLAEPADDPPPVTVLPPDEPRQPLRPLRVLTRSQLADLPRPEPLIDGILDLRTVALLAGSWGTLKSFIALDWGASIATGRPWMGRPTRQGHVVYVSAEGAHGLDQRLTAWEVGWRRTIPDEFQVVPEPVSLLDHGRVSALVEMVAGTTLVVIDTFARCLVGADENSARDVGIAVGALYRLRAATADGTVLVVHHTGKDKATIRGSSALEAGVDTIYTTEGDLKLVQLTRTKRKDGAPDDTHRVHLHLVDGTGSGLIESVREGADMTSGEDRLLSAFLSAFGDRQASKAELRMVAGLPPATFHRALNGLVKRGALLEHMPGSRAFYTKGNL